VCRHAFFSLAPWFVAARCVREGNPRVCHDVALLIAIVILRGAGIPIFHFAGVLECLCLGIVHGGYHIGGTLARCVYRSLILTTIDDHDFLSHCCSLVRAPLGNQFDTSDGRIQCDTKYKCITELAII